MPRSRPADARQFTSWLAKDWYKRMIAAARFENENIRQFVQTAVMNEVRRVERRMPKVSDHEHDYTSFVWSGYQRMPLGTSTTEFLCSRECRLCGLPERQWLTKVPEAPK